MYHASAEKICLNFRIPAGTSRGILQHKNSWIIKIWEVGNPITIGRGEASILETLSPDWSDDYENFLKEACNNVDQIISSDLANLINYPSIRFAFEAALRDLKNGGNQNYFPSEFTAGNKGININGLIWMGDEQFMLDQIEAKIAEGYGCIKLKIGAIDFETEIKLLQSIRKKYNADSIELRVDANGAFHPTEALIKLQRLAELDLHSIEQPIKQGQIADMTTLCKNTPLAIALDEELIGIHEIINKEELISTIQPQYIILKPSLLGGFKATDEWIEIAEKNNIKWWITSALESNIGLNAIAQYTFKKDNPMPQGLGTGRLFTNNMQSSLYIEKDHLYSANTQIE